MSSVFNRTTYEYRTSVHSPDYSAEEWIHNPDMSSVSEVPPKYRKASGDLVVEMSQEEKEAVDAAAAQEEAAQLNAEIVGKIIVSDDSAVSPQIQAVIADNAIWTDAISGLKGPPQVMQCLVNRRELIGDNENVVGGYAGATNNRVLNLELIHGKTGWHSQQIYESRYTRPRDLLIYYGYPNSFNSQQHFWDNEKVAQEMAQYGQVVLGNGVADSGHADYANTSVIVPRIKELNPTTVVFGYVTANQSQANFQTEVDKWDALSVDGIFLDEAGYDYGSNNRIDFNSKVDYVHGKASAKVCFVNAWNMDHVIGVADDPSFPNSTHNPGEVESSLTLNDWYLLESHPVNTSAYSASDGYQQKADWTTRGVKAIGHRYNYGVNVSAVGVIDNDEQNGQDLFNFGFIAAVMFSLDSFGTSNTSYGSGGAVKWWTRPDVSGLGVITWLSPSVQNDGTDVNVCLRYTENAQLKVDFSSGAQSSSITKW